MGTYNAYLSGSNLNIDFTPNSPLSVQHNISTIQVSISNTSYVGIGTSTINNSSLSSNYVSIASSTSPIQNIISSYSNQIYNSSYYIVSIEDITNNAYQVSEVLVVDDYGSYGNAYITEFGIVETKSSLGTISADVSGSKTNLYFTPIAGINVQVRVFQHSLGLSNLDIKDTSIIF